MKYFKKTDSKSAMLLLTSLDWNGSVANAGWILVCCTFMNVLPLISIIIPVYRVERYLRTCMDSVLNQTYANLEIICVNDDSPDGSGEILKEYAERDPRVSVIDRANGGLAAARNTGLEAAHGAYVGFVDSDDWIEPCMYASLVEAMEAADADLAVCGVCLEYEVAADARERTCDRRYFARYVTGFHPLDASVVRSLDVCAWDKLYRRDLIEKYGIRFPDGYRYEDNVFFWAYAIRCRSVAILEGKWYHYRRRPNSIISEVRVGECSHSTEAVEVYALIAEDLRACRCFDKYAEPFFVLLAGQVGLACASDRKRANILAGTLLKKYQFHQYIHLFGAADEWVVQRLLPLCRRPGWRERFVSRIFRRHVSPCGTVRYKILGVRCRKIKS